LPHYALAFSDPAGHLIDVEMTLPQPVPGQQIAMPAWIPGSYLVREFARHVVTLSAEQSGRAVKFAKLDKATWQFQCTVDAPLVVRYRLYAWDRSVRACYFDQSRGFVNAAAALMKDCAKADAACTLDVPAPAFAGAARWRCATAMTAERVDARGFGRYRAANYDELIDHPIECSDFDEFSFAAGGVTHRFVISGQQRGDLARLCNDTRKICQGHCDLFASREPGAAGTPSKAPFEHYLFLLHVVDDGHGGLEHRASTALLAPRNHLPRVGDASVSEGYLDLLGLISHEYFHAWNVKRIKPAAFMTADGAYDTTKESYTRLLWIFEGFTSYYDDLMLKRVGLITEADYLKLLGRRLTQQLRSPGAMLQPVTDASFDAWIKYYRADENAPNSQFSYYLRGSLIALALDLTQRASGDDAPTLDDIMHAMWREFGLTGRGFPEQPSQWFSAQAQRDLTGFFDRYIDGTESPDWVALFQPFAIQYKTRASASASDRGGRHEAGGGTSARTLGLLFAETGASLPTLKHVLSGSAAWQAGLSAGDAVVAIDGLRASATTLGTHLPRFGVGDTLRVTYFRHDVLHETLISVPPAPVDAAWLEVSADETVAATRRDRWLAQP
jgi:predicted metalloprotease with PDZ domain